MKIINCKSDRQEALLIKRDQAVIQLNKEEMKLFEFILKNLVAGKPTPEIEMILVPFCINCGCTQEHACEGGCNWVDKFKCSSCYDENGYRTK